MEFEWDDEKNQRNIEKHGVGFEMASQIFNGFTFDAVDERFDYGEMRTISIGRIDNVAYLAVVHTDRNGNCRIISARQANKKEIKRYDEEIHKAFDA